MEPIQFYHNPMSRGRIVHWILEETGAPYNVNLLDWNKKQHKDPKYLAINPMGKIPSIVHRGTVITEVAAICTYLADAFPKAGLAPALEDAARGTYYRWLFFGAGCIEPAMIDKMFNRAAIDRPGAQGYGTFEDTFNTLEKALSPGPFLLGSKFTAADLYICSQLSWGAMTKALEPKPVFQQYVARCNDRPAFKRTLDQSKALEEKLKAST